MQAERFILGTVQLGLPYGVNNNGSKLSEDAAFEILDAAFANKVHILDTADAYGDAQYIIGKYIKSTGRNFLINTKFKVHGDVSITKQLEHSLHQLNSNTVHTYFYHRFEEMIDVPSSLQELSILKEKGLIKKIGVSIYTNDEFIACIESSIIDVIQLPFNLLDNFGRRGELLKEAKQRGKEIQVRSVFLQGLFFKNPDSFSEILQPLKQPISCLQKLAIDKNVSMHDLALSYALVKNEIDYIIIGVDSVQQLQYNLKASTGILDNELEHMIDSIKVQKEELLYPYNWK
jgi:uncharacterized protein